MFTDRSTTRAWSLFLIACAAWPAFADGGFALRIVSSRPDTVSGGDVLVQITASRDSQWSAWMGDRNVTQLFRASGEPGHFLGLLTGLKEGTNRLELRAAGAVKEKLDIVNHPLKGPVISGPHQQPFLCQTDAAGLGTEIDADCSAKTVVQYYYKSTQTVAAPSSMAPPSPVDFAPGFKPYDQSARPAPSDIAQIKTSDGKTVPYIVRREIGTINRGVYDIQFVHQPGQPLPDPWAHPTPGWNGRLVYLFDGGCRAGYRQGTFFGSIGAANEPYLSEGYATATSTLNAFGNNCNDRISAETMSMVKEHFTKEYGEPVHTIGWGGSGGAMEQYLIAQNYPGLLDGIIPFVSFPDMLSTAPPVVDCTLLDRAFKTSKLRWTDAEKTAVSGFATWRTCSQALADWLLADPGYGCQPPVPDKMVYDRAANPKGLRCDIYDGEVNVLGRDRETGRVLRPLDNVGIQYGLNAFNSGKIDAEHFLELNERIGGFDEDGKMGARRTTATAVALRMAYERGLVLTGTGGLGGIPIIDWRAYSDDMADNHDRVRSFVVRARLIAANGNAANQVIITYPRPSASDTRTFMQTYRTESQFPERVRDLVGQMNRWLDDIAADRAAGGSSEKVARNKPADIADACWATSGEHIVEAATYSQPGRCNELYPAHGDPELAAGAPLTEDVLKCALKPVNAGDYQKPLNADQLQRLQAIFPTGVCDYSRPGIEQRATSATWWSYQEPGK